MVRLDLVDAITAVTDLRPLVLAVADGAQLPSGALGSSERSLQTVVRRQVEQSPGVLVDYPEQLYTFADRSVPAAAPGHISIGYMGLAREQPLLSSPSAGWHGWYEYFPWEDRRPSASEAGLPIEFLNRLRSWADSDLGLRPGRREQVSVAFGLDGCAWNEEFILNRYELLYEAGLVPEAHGRSSISGPTTVGGKASPSRGSQRPPLVSGVPMDFDHRRVLATAIARLRTKLKYRPVMFELLSPAFTLLQLQQTVEALSGCALYKPNFRRFIAQQSLVEETADTLLPPRGRPARLYRFRDAVKRERAATGALLPRPR